MKEEKKMVARALEKYLKISPKKVRPLARLIKRKKVDKALYVLAATKKKAAHILKGTLESALNNAKRIPETNFTEENLYISKIAVDPGPVLKRHRAMSMGRAGIIRKRSSHILIELESVGRTELTSQKKKNTKPASSGKTVKTRKR